MIRVYYNDTQSIVGVEHTKTFRYTTLEHAIQLVQGKKHVSSHKRDLTYVVESLLIAGWEETK